MIHPVRTEVRIDLLKEMELSLIARRTVSSLGDKYILLVESSPYSTEQEVSCTSLAAEYNDAELKETEKTLGKTITTDQMVTEDRTDQGLDKHTGIAVSLSYFLPF